MGISFPTFKKHHKGQSDFVPTIFQVLLNLIVNMSE
jgi:hypothetical protein